MMTAEEWVLVVLAFLLAVEMVALDAWRRHRRRKEIEEQSGSDREMPKECGLKAQIREAVVEVMAEEKAKRAECEYFQRKQWSLMDARKKCGIEPPYSTTTECHYGKEPLRYVEYDLSDVPVAQMVEELRKRTGVSANFAEVWIRMADKNQRNEKRGR